MDAGINMNVIEQALGGIHLPPCPATLLAVMKKIQSSGTDPGQIARLIGQDAGLSAPLIKLANSPYFGLRSKVSSVQQAIIVLGLKNTANLLRNAALRARVSPGLPGMEKFWDRSSMTAMAASCIAKRIAGVSCEDAYTVGLFHDCGIPVLMQKHSNYSKDISEMSILSGNACIAENTRYSTTHAIVGNLLARNWLLPTNICRAILHHHDLTILTPTATPAMDEVCKLVGIIQAAEHVVDSYLNLRSREWLVWKPLVLEYLQFSKWEFDELRSDIVDVLSGYADEASFASI